MSKVQELQMITVSDSNVHSLCLKGILDFFFFFFLCISFELRIITACLDSTFDDCQSIVKTLFGDLEFKKKYRLGAINSINWSRIMSQTIYYFYAYPLAT